MNDNIFEFKKPIKNNTSEQTYDELSAAANARLNPIVVQLKEALVKEFGMNVDFVVLVRRNSEPVDGPGSKLAATNLTLTSDLFHLLNQSSAFVYDFTNAQLLNALELINTINTKPIE